MRRLPHFICPARYGLCIFCGFHRLFMIFLLKKTETWDILTIIPMINITKDTIIGDILDVAPQTAPIFFSIGMHCLGCPSSRGETVEEACAVHGVDVDKLLELVNQEANKAAE